MTLTDRTPETKPGLGLRDCLRVYWPLGLTFMMMSGADPIVTTGLRRIGDFMAADRALSAYLLAFTVQLVVHSPLFVTREIVLTVARDRDSFKLARRFMYSIAAMLSCVDLLVAATPLGDAIFGLMLGKSNGAVSAGSAELIQQARMTLGVMAILPFFIAGRGLNQALLIRHDRSLWVGAGTMARLIGLGAIMATLVHVAPELGPVAGAIAFVLGIAIEAWMARINARKERRQLAIGRGDGSRESVRSLARFALPLMAGNMVGNLSMPFFAGVAGHAAVATASIAAFGLVRTLSITCGTPVFALQAIVTAKGTSTANRRVLARFALLTGLSLALLLSTFTLPGVADTIFIGIFNAPEHSLTYRLAISTLPWAIVLPLLVAAKATMRGIIIRRRATARLLGCTLTSIGLPAAYFVFVATDAGAIDRATAAYVGWLASIIIELLALTWILLAGRVEE